jgi:hypothetical protein
MEQVEFMSSPHWLSRDLFLFVMAVLMAVIGLVSCAPTPTPLPMGVLESDPAGIPTSSPMTIVTRQSASPTARPSPAPIPNVPGLAVRPEYGMQGNLVGARYENPDGTVIATFDAQDRLHNDHVTWHWERMNQSERDQALAWLFDPQQMQYSRFEDREEWVIRSITKWIPRLTDFVIPTDSKIAIHWQADGPPMSLVSLYEALSRVKSLSLIRERRSCSYGHSELGLIELGGETVLFTAPGWQTVSVGTREILTAVWIIKEAMVIYYPQSLGWASSCPSEPDHLKTEYYSTIWLVKAQQALSKFVPADKGYWEQQEIPFQIRNITTQTFPACLPTQTADPVTPTVEPCFPLP